MCLCFFSPFLSITPARLGIHLCSVLGETLCISPRFRPALHLTSAKRPPCPILCHEPTTRLTIAHFSFSSVLGRPPDPITGSFPTSSSLVPQHAPPFSSRNDPTSPRLSTSRHPPRSPSCHVPHFLFTVFFSLPFWRRFPPTRVPPYFMGRTRVEFSHSPRLRFALGVVCPPVLLFYSPIKNNKEH